MESRTRMESLHRACCEGDVDLVRQLIEQEHVDPNIPDHSGLLPLHLACERGSLELVKLLSNHCDVNTITLSQGRGLFRSPLAQIGNTPLHIACRKGSTEIVKYLIEEKHCNTNTTNDSGKLPLHLACKHGSLELVKLVSDGCDVNARGGGHGHTPLHFACRMGSLEIVKYLIEEKHCNTNTTNDVGQLPLHLACERGSLELVKLLSNHCDVNAKTLTQRFRRGFFLSPLALCGDTPLHIACRKGSTEIVKYLIEEKHCNTNTTNDDDQFPLHLACERGSLELVKLLSNHCDVNTITLSQGRGFFLPSSGDTPLHIACRKGSTEIVKYLIEKKHCDPNTTNDDGQLLLHLACQHGSLELVKLLSSYGNVNARTRSGDTTVHMACRKVSLEIVKYLIEEKHCYPNTTNDSGKLPLHLACEHGSLELVKLLSSHGNVNARTRSGDTTVHMACRKVSLEIVKYLIEEKHCYPNTTNGSGKLPLHLACEHGSLELVKLLSSHGNVNARTQSGNTPLHMACRKGSTEIVKYLIEEKHCNTNTTNDDGQLPLHLACEHGSLELVKLVSDGCDVNATGGGWLKDTPLHIACRKGSTKIVKYLIEEKHCNTNTTNDDGQLPLHLACEHGSLELVKLVSDGCDVNATGGGWLKDTPLHIACRKGSTEIVKYLIEEKHCNTNTTNDDGQLPLHLACEHGSLELVKLVSDGCDVNATGGGWLKDTPLHMACRKGSTEIVKYLIEEKHCNTNTTNDDGQLPLHLACQHGSLGLVKLLSSHGNVNARTRRGNTPLHMACRKVSTEFVKYLIEEKHCNTNTTNDDGQLPLHLACEHGSLELVKLVSDGCDVNARGGGRLKRDTPLHIACRSGSLETVKYLIEEKHCDTNATNGNGQLPLHLACECGSLEVVKLVSNCDLYVESQRKEDETSETPLHIACRCNRPEIVTHLIKERNCNPMRRNSRGTSPVDTACNHESFEAIGAIYTINPQDDEGNTVLHAAFRHNPHIVEYLVKEKQCNPMYPNYHGTTPTHLALQKSSLEIIQVIVHHYIGWQDLQDDNGNTILHLACQYQHNISAIVVYLLQQHSDPRTCNTSGDTPLHIACKAGSLDAVKAIVRNCVSWQNWQDNDGNTILHFACKYQCIIEIVGYLLEQQFDPRKCNAFGDSPLQLACEADSLDAVKAIVTADPEWRDELGYTPLHVACKCCNKVETVACIIKATPRNSTELRDKEGNTPLHIACRYARSEIVTFLIEQKCYDLTSLNSSGELPLHIACGRRHVLAHSLKLVSKCDVNATTENGDTPLHIACRNGSVERVSYLVKEKDCRTDIQNNDQELPLHIACKKQDLEMCRLLSNNSDPNCRTNLGNTPLHEACRAIKAPSKSKELVQYLIEERSCNPNCQNTDGTTPLHYACVRNSYETVEYLLTSGKADPSILDCKGQTPLMFAFKPEIIKVLLEHGADAKPLYKSYADFFEEQSSTTPPPTPLKVVVLGNAATGKTTLIESFKCEMGSSTPQAEPHTAGIIPSDFESDVYGLVTWYDFAGQHEYYASHEAILHSIIAASPPVILLVTDISEPEDIITKKLLYWLSFVENQCQCSSSIAKPHLIFVGSHADVVEDNGSNPQEILHMALECLRSRLKKSTVEMVTAVSLDCRDPECPGINKLQHQLKNSSMKLQAKVMMDFTCHCFYVFLLDKFQSHSAVTITEITRVRQNITDDTLSDDELYSTDEEEEDSGEESSNTLVRLDKDLLELLPTTSEGILALCEELHSRGHVILLKESASLHVSWVVLNKEALLSEVNGTVFAPRNFKQHRDLATSTGVVSLSKITAHFPQYEPTMILEFLSHMEFCREITDKEVLHLITDKSSDDLESYYFFPSLISINTPQSVWKQDPRFGYQCGWILQCSQLDQFLTPRFLQVLLLRLAFAFALVPSKPPVDQDFPALRRVCSVWKNGISWRNMDGVEAVVEVTEQGQAVVVMLRCLKGLTSEVSCIQLRSSLIQKVLGTKEEFCSLVSTTDSFIDPQSLQYPLKEPSQMMTLFGTSDVARTISEGKQCVLNDHGELVNVEEMLYFEPYANFGEDVIQDLFSEQNASKDVTDKFLYQIADKVHQKKELFTELFNPNPTLLQERVSRAPPGPTHELVRVFQTWRDCSEGTYQCLREELDKYSVFCGRNPLVSLLCQAVLPEIEYKSILAVRIDSEQMLLSIEAQLCTRSITFVLSVARV